MRQVMGIDPSLTSTGVCWGSSGEDYDVQTCTSKPIGKSVGDRIKRYERLTEQITAVCDTVRPSVILIEEYAYSKNMGGQMYLGEFGGILRAALVEYTPHVLEVTATGLKKFATGKGNSPKDLVMAHVAQRWGKIFASNDEADAFVLYQMGLCLIGQKGATTAPQREAVAKVMEGHAWTVDQIREYVAGEMKPKVGQLLRSEVLRLRGALSQIVAHEPCTDGGNCFYEHTDGDGNYMGFENADPLGVIGSMVTVARDALSKGV